MQALSPQVGGNPTTTAGGRIEQKLQADNEFSAETITVTTN